MSTETENKETETADKNTRFRNGEEGVVIDVAKRLLWLKKDTWQMTGKWMNWVQVREYSEKLNRKKYAGFGDWRMPTAAEVKSLYDKSQKNKDHMGQMVAHEEIFDAGFGFLCWTSDVRNKLQAVRFGFRKGLIMYDDIYRTSRGSTRLVRDIEKEDGLL